VRVISRKKHESCIVARGKKNRPDKNLQELVDEITLISIELIRRMEHPLNKALKSTQK
jgi:hypothetical protein